MKQKVKPVYKSVVTDTGFSLDFFSSENIGVTKKEEEDTQKGKEEEGTQKGKKDMAKKDKEEVIAKNKGNGIKKSEESYVDESNTGFSSP